MATFTWIDGNGSWTVAGNWSTDSVPNSSTANVFIVDSTSTVTLSTSVSLDSLQLAVGNALDISSGSVLSVGSQIDNAGTILIAAGANNAALNTVGPVSLTGGGTMILSNGTSGNQALISQSTTGSPLTNVDNTIEGFGQIGVNGLALVNEGTVDANAPGQTLTLSGGGVTNSGLLEATGSGALSITTSVNNTGGDITADGATVAISNEEGITVTGGTLNTSSGGILEAVGAGEVLNGVTISSGSTFTIGSGGATQIEGTIDNAGTILIAAGDNNAALDTNGTVSLTGDGTVILSNGTSGFQALIAQSIGSSPLTNVDNTIEGSGQIGVSGLALANEGTVDANAPGQTLTLSGGGVTNVGLLEATGSGELSITTSVNNTGGDITADGAMVAIDNSAVIAGGTLNTSGGGTLESVGGGVVLNGVTISSGSTYTIGSGGVTQIEGTIDNAGTILIAAGTNNAALDTDGAVSLTGDGTVILSNGTSGNQALIAQSVTSSPLTNVNNTIEGFGQIGVSGLAPVNEGTVDANVSGQTLTLSGGGVTNLGLVEATGGGALSITTSVNNTGGDITADGATVAISNSAVITGGTLNTSGGGTLESVGGGVVLNGVTISAGSTYTIGSGGVTQIEGTIDNAGTILIAAGTNNAALDTDGAVSLTGAGTVILSNGTSGNQALIAQSVGDSPLTNVNNTIEGFGQIGVNGLALVNEGTVDANLSGQTLILSGGGVTNSGLLEASNGGSLDVTTTLGGGGQLETGAGAQIELAGVTNETATFTGAVGAQLKLDAPASYTGTLVAFAPGETIDLVNIDATSAVISGTTMIVDIGGGGTLAYGVSTAYAGDHLKVSSDNNGGTDIIAYGLALPGPHAPEPANLGDAHVGAVATEALSLSNTAPANGYYETLDASIGNATAEVTATGSFSLLAAGSTDSTHLVVGLDTSADGNKSGTATITLTSDGTAVDGLGTTAIGTQTVNIAGTVYNYATASAAAPDPVNFGIVHVGDTISQTLTIRNLATADGFSENLDGSIGDATGGVVANGSFIGLAAVTADTTDLSVGVITSAAGTISGTATITLQSDGAGIDTLGTTVLTAQTVIVDATVNNYVTAAIEELSGGGTFDQSGTTYTLNLGTITQGTSVSAIDLGVLNDVSGPSDLLSGSFTESVSGAFGLTGFGPFSGLEAGQVDSNPTIILSTTDTGSFTETVTLTPDGSNASGFNQVLQQETLTISADIAPCFLAGTRISTERGEVAVEVIGVGERVRVVLGDAAGGDGLAEVIWVGQREVDCARHPKPRQVWPVRVAAGTFGPGRPHTEMFLSPDHSIYVEEVLIPVKHLINGSTIAQVPVDRVTYYHIELPQHDVVLAEGLPAESFLDIKDGSNYANRPERVRLYPDFTAQMWEVFGCARLVVTGPELEAARALVESFAAERAAA